MRAAAAALLASVVVLGVWACGTDAGDDTPPLDDGQDASRVDLAYCTRYCDAQAKAGTLAGSRTDCVRRCCGTSRPDCTIPDSGLPPPSDAGEEPRGDGSTCATPCGAACCADGEACHSESGGSLACVKTCAEGKDCSTGCCAPATNVKGEPVGPYVCKPNDGKPYHCCNGAFTTCGGIDGVTMCCVTDTKGNDFCARSCGMNTECGASHCVGYTFGTFTTTCSGPTACGP
jgi:hypothetical protein